MQVSFDPKYNIAYIKLKEKTDTVNSIEISKGIVIDLAPDGTLYGIELLDASNQLFSGKKDTLRLLNESTGISREFEMPF